MHDYNHRVSTLYLVSNATRQGHLYVNGHNIHGAIRFSLPWMLLEVSHLDLKQQQVQKFLTRLKSFDTNKRSH